MIEIKKEVIYITDEIEIVVEDNITKNLLYNALREELFDALYNAYHINYV